MQNTELDAVLSQTLEKARRNILTLVIGNKNYSSWSMRPWVVLTAFDIPFQEVRICLDQPDTDTNIAEYSAAGRVPVLIDGQLTVWDSLAICEYLAEQCSERALWPKETAARAVARSICAEMHSGFGGLRSAMSMDIRASYPGRGRTPEAQGDIGRICEIWEDCLSKFGHHEFLFGDFSIADAYFAPVVMRFRTYQVSLAPALQAYCDRVAAHPAVASWIAGALAETEVLPDH
ncbi:glutathione S-transferase [Herbaspirillum sp. Sphag1AN]|uniref:glutathione S-transferase family protein n=1 Tax=unclassified Herbaspirillum TaxID=2624150 RepID=UPI0016077498|nr:MULTISPECIES: glutathione S-transferase family protein [unclassified Herbaspirillum]MBB3212527.1 glutathione S-transferase [Herbaspirillum sp. Sphag1AN]MBB3245724.1 glutathione S-transferase [Herbaspirillum sp. Sphag64]